MKAELKIDTQELAQEITQRVLNALKPLLNKKEDSTIFDVQALGDYLNVSSKWIYERTHMNEIPHYKVTGKLMFKKKEIDNWLDVHKVPAIKNFRLVKK